MGCKRGGGMRVLGLVVGDYYRVMRRSSSMIMKMWEGREISQISGEVI